MRRPAAWPTFNLDAHRRVVVLQDLPTRHREDIDARLERRRLASELADRQARLAAEASRAVLVLFQGMDTGGKDGCIRHVFGDCSPQGVHVTAFGVPSQEERRHDFLWRHHRRAPQAGHIGVWNRSHYGGVLVERVLGIVDDETVRRRYAHINAFEAMLHDEGTRVVKFFLHISKEEQRKRLQARLDDPRKRWKFDHSDIRQRDQWDAYMAAYDEAIEATDSPHAPWHVIPADKKPMRDVLVARRLLGLLDEMAPQYPEPKDLPERID